MRMILGSISLLGVLVATTMSMAQPPGGGPPGRRGQGGGMDMTAIISQMLTMDANQDGMLTSDEVSDKRMLSILKRADANNDGAVTQDELTTFAKKANNQQPGGRGGQGGPGGRNGRDMGPPPKPGQILPAHLQDELNLTEAQKKKIEALQKEVDAKLAKILTDEQRQQLEEIGNRGPGGHGGPGGGGPGGFGPPPGGGPPSQDF